MCYISKELKAENHLEGDEIMTNGVTTHSRRSHLNHSIDLCTCLKLMLRCVAHWGSGNAYSSATYAFLPPDDFLCWLPHVAPSFLLFLLLFSSQYDHRFSRNNSQQMDPLELILLQTLRAERDVEYRLLKGERCFPEGGFRRVEMVV